jgi:hypothetical protein
VVEVLRFHRQLGPPVSSHFSVARANLLKYFFDSKQKASAHEEVINNPIINIFIPLKIDIDKELQTALSSAS